MHEYIVHILVKPTQERLDPNKAETLKTPDPDSAEVVHAPLDAHEVPMSQEEVVDASPSVYRHRAKTAPCLEPAVDRRAL